MVESQRSNGRNYETIRLCLESSNEYQRRAPIHTTFDDMLEFDEQINNPEEGCAESHQDDVHEGQLENPRSNSKNSNKRRRTLLQGGPSRVAQSTTASSNIMRTNRGFHNAARGFVDEHSLPHLQLDNSSPCDHCGAKLFPHETNQFCCLKGKVKLPDLPVPPELMQL
ncbi:hypothetical protein MKW98_023398 [Papaver atlanticum]|uniref:Uncharacterized protein n=1 Tax=Papaver atlanticum TaxID=357466 RepID=A0AAD4SYQ2_9MAGN|nr:hypothetical protein MKW98_023398 [Papaver atlanticum]